MFPQTDLTVQSQTEAGSSIVEAEPQSGDADFDFYARPANKDLNLFFLTTPINPPERVGAYITPKTGFKDSGLHIL